MAKKKKAEKTMDEVTAGYESFIAGKKINSTGKKLFKKTLKKATRSSNNTSK